MPPSPPPQPLSSLVARFIAATETTTTTTTTTTALSALASAFPRTWDEMVDVSLATEAFANVPVSSVLLPCVHLAQRQTAPPHHQRRDGTR